MAAPTVEESFKAPSLATRVFESLRIQGQKFLDTITPLKAPRWVFCILSLAAFCARIYFVQGWYIIAYVLGIYLLNLFIQFLSPRDDPALMEYENEGDEPQLPTKQNEEFRPFVRRLPEFKFWLSAQRAILLGIASTFFQVFNVPVFWPILVVYFIVLFGVSMKRQIKHMIRYKYLPFTTGKPKHKGKEDTGKVVKQ
eukprot:m.227678 g.227678  ORF g.227678 m.227678 type:complete len:197 (+) comp11624_c0_seq1:36-626(+)